MSESSPALVKVLIAFALVYVIWGSTYLAILFAIETLPPFLMAAVRFLAAGIVLYAWSRWREGAVSPTPQQWYSTIVVGVLLLAVGNGLVVWSETRVASGVAALLVAIIPCWMVLMDWLRPGGAPPRAQVVAGLVLGMAGLVWLVGPESVLGAGRVDFVGAAALMVASFAWATGSIYSRHAALPPSPFLSTAMQMLAGGAALLLVGLGVGEAGQFDADTVTFRSVAAMLYLIVFGSIVAFTAYVWLLRVSTPARVSTYAYVNPVIAVFLGWGLAGEVLTPRMLAAAAVIVGGVAMITLAPKPAAASPAPAESCTACTEDADQVIGEPAPTAETASLTPALVEATAGGEQDRSV